MFTSHLSLGDIKTPKCRNKKEVKVVIDFSEYKPNSYYYDVLYNYNYHQFDSEFDYQSTRNFNSSRPNKNPLKDAILILNKPTIFKRKKKKDCTINKIAPCLPHGFDDNKIKFTEITRESVSLFALKDMKHKSFDAQTNEPIQKQAGDPEEEELRAWKNEHTHTNMGGFLNTWRSKYTTLNSHIETSLQDVEKCLKQEGKALNTKILYNTKKLQKKSNSISSSLQLKDEKIIILKPKILEKKQAAHAKSIILSPQFTTEGKYNLSEFKSLKKKIASFQRYNQSITLNINKFKEDFLKQKRAALLGKANIFIRYPKSTTIVEKEFFDKAKKEVDEQKDFGRIYKVNNKFLLCKPLPKPQITPWRKNPS